jgi:hypothetical protein
VVAGARPRRSLEATITPPLLTNGGFHNIGTGTASGDSPDFGRGIGIQAALSTEFNCRGPYRCRRT